ncbi:endospore germination permease [Paenibacillus solisilvae]|uniref:Endospore germination permease n=1 Tax=Paenibacillus solisilvae TaxID=2486751 RepID=A0ABW0W780_9BACL
MKISGLQILWLIFSMQIGMILLRLTQAIAQSKQDAWISVLLAGVAGIGITYVSAKVSVLYPNQTFIEFTQTILGKWLGKIVIITYFFQWYTGSAVIIRRSSDFLHLALFHRTPVLILIASMLLLVLYALYEGGIEGIARCSEVIGPLIFITLIFIFCLSLNNLDWHMLLPVFTDSGWKDIMKGSLSPTSLLAETFMLVMLIAFMNEPKKGPSQAIWGVGIAFGFVFIATLFVIMTFGPNLSGRMMYAFYDVVRFISMMEFIQNVDVIIIVVWMTSFFIKLSLYVFICCYGTAQFFRIQNWRALIWVVIPIVLFLAMLPANELFGIEYNQKYLIPFVLPVNFIFIPLLLWFVGAIRKNKEKEGEHA